MGFLNRDPPLEPNEQIRWRKPSTLSIGQSINTEVGGTLFVTTRGLVFMPNRLNPPWIKGRRSAYRIPQEDISTIDVKEPDSRTPYTTGQRRRVRVQRPDGQCDLFLMNHPDEVAAEIRSLLGITEA
jgi:hypothetical protein